MTRVVREAAGLEAVERALSAGRVPVRVSGSGRGLWMRMASEQIGQVRLDHATFATGLHFRVDAAPADGLYIGHLKSGALTSSAEGTQRTHSPGDVFLASPPGHARSGDLRDADVEVAILPVDLISQAAGTAPGQAPVKFLSYAPVSPSAARTWKDACAYVRAALADPGISGQPLLAAAAGRLLAAVALTAFPNTTTAGPDGRDRRDATPATLRRAITFIDEHAHEDISPADIAAAACATLRAVQLAFQRHMNTTPTGYLRRVRLDHARRDLVAASPASTTVTAIAARWGFASPSRFTAEYRRAYGCLPGHTLRV